MRQRTEGGALRVAVLSLLLTLVGACGDSIIDASVHITKMESAPSDALITEELRYERIGDKQGRMTSDAASAWIDPDTELTAWFDPDAFARIAHVTDAQIREERGLLRDLDLTEFLEEVAKYYTAPEGTKRQALQEANSAFVWLAHVLTLNAIHAEWPIDLTVHTGDAVDIGLRSELAHFLFAAHRLEMPYLDVAGNHDLFTFGNFGSGGTLFGIGLDTEVTAHPTCRTAFLFNDECLVEGQANFAARFREIVDDLGVHGPTWSAFRSRCFGHDLAPESDALHYSVVVRPHTETEPGLQLVVLETNREESGHGPRIHLDQLQWLNDLLDAPGTRDNLVVVCAHHPVVELHRGDQMLGEVEREEISDPLKHVAAMLTHYPNVILFLCGHTHLPSIWEKRDGRTGALEWLQIDSGSLLVAPQLGSLIELRLETGVVRVEATRVGALVDAETDLGLRVEESRAAAGRDSQSAPRYTPWSSYSGWKPLPEFPVAVPKYELEG